MRVQMPYNKEVYFGGQQLMEVCLLTELNRLVFLFM